MPASTLSHWMSLAFVGFGAFFAVSGATAVLRAVRRRQNWRTCAGTVVSSRLDDGQIRCQVAFEYEGREVRFWNPHTTAVGIDPVGRPVTVLVNPADPGQAVVSKGQSRPEAAGVGFLVFGLAAVVIGARLSR